MVKKTRQRRMQMPMHFMSVALDSKALPVLGERINQGLIKEEINLSARTKKRKRRENEKEEGKEWQNSQEGS